MALHRRSGAGDTWTTAGILTQTLDPAQNLVQAQVITLSQFAVLGPPSYRAYFPNVGRIYVGGW